MKKNILLGAYLLFCVSLTAQNIVISDSLIWQESLKMIDENGNQKKMLSFYGAQNRDFDLLPIYFRKTKAGADVNIQKVETISEVYEEITADELENIENIENIQSAPEINTVVSLFRKNAYIGFELLPIRKNKISGVYEKLVKFEYKIHYNNVYLDKTSNTFTNTSVLNSGKWYKMRVSESGIYKLTYEQLVDMGFSNFSNIGVFGYGGILPKIVGEPIYDDLPERPIQKVDANSNSTFDAGDYLLFYADGPHKINFDPTGDFGHEYNTYSSYSYYFVSDQGTWKQPSLQNSLDSFDEQTSTYDDYVFLEKDTLNLMSTGRNWFWREFDYYLNHSFNTTIPNVSLKDTVEVKIALVARSSIRSRFDIIINGLSQPQISIESVTTSALAAYAKENTLNTFRVIPSSDDFNIDIKYTKTSTNSEGWLDYISFKLRRELKLNGGYLNFRNTKTVSANNKVQYNLSNVNSSTIVWDITNRTEAKKINVNSVGNSLSFVADASDLREYVAFNVSSSFPSPQYLGTSDVGAIKNQNLHSYTEADLIIVTHPDFYSTAEDIKQMHETYDDLKVILVMPNEIYNEFSSGAPDVAAIRNFVKMIYDRANTESEIPQNLLLLGDGTYDNYGISEDATNFILTYQSFESLLPARTYVTDDFYVFLDDGEGDIDGNHDIDMGVGRLPVKTQSEANGILNKMKAYYSSATHGNWKNNILIVADDAEDNEPFHQTQANNLAIQLENSYPWLNIEKVFLDDFEQESTAQGHKYPDVNQAITDNINNGVMLVEWIGHGNEKSWAHESVLTLNMIAAWENFNKYPIFVTATCEFSPYDKHELVSGGEEIILNPNGGGIALFTTTRIAFSASNALLSSRFHDYVFSDDSNGKVNSLGMSVIKAKNSLIGDTNKRVFALLANPAMRPSQPKYSATTTKINNQLISEFSDTIKAQSHITIENGIYNTR